jgi:hypothetical protein
VQLWQIVLFLICAIFTAVVIGVFIAYIVLRFVHKDSVTLLYCFRMLFTKIPKATSLSNLDSPSDQKHEALLAIEEKPTPPPVVKEPASVIPAVEDRRGESILRLFTELERNYKTAREFSGDNLVPLQTEVWDASQHTLHRLNTNLKNDIERIYADIGLLNHLVWFSSEFHSHSPSLREQYVNILMRIAERLEEIIKVPLSHFT